MKVFFQAQNPGRERLRNDFPFAFFFLHSEHDPVSLIIADINGKHTFIESAQFAKVKFSQAPISLHQFGELYIFFELYVHVLID